MAISGNPSTGNSTRLRTDFLIARRQERESSQTQLAKSVHDNAIVQGKAKWEAKSFDTIERANANRRCSHLQEMRQLNLAERQAILATLLAKEKLMYEEEIKVFNS
eukprot:GHVT01005281.1.p2 GENE.GHVT01005281.1~~GHVT01005281.1.p2  ORF type:complete len:106 (+),score=11.73 GHVT01005281.1:2198-2515(+)